MQEQRYARVEWTVGDVTSITDDLSDEQAEAFLLRNEKYLAERLVELGFQVIEDLLSEEVSG